MDALNYPIFDGAWRIKSYPDWMTLEEAEITMIKYGKTKLPDNRRFFRISTLKPIEIKPFGECEADVEIGEIVVEKVPK